MDGPVQSGSAEMKNASNLGQTEIYLPYAVIARLWKIYGRLKGLA